MAKPNKSKAEYVSPWPQPTGNVTALPNWGDLPDLALLNIFKYLEGSDVARMESLCKSFRTFAHDLTLWKKFYRKDLKFSRQFALEYDEKDGKVIGAKFIPEDEEAMDLSQYRRYNPWKESYALLYNAINLVSVDSGPHEFRNVVLDTKQGDNTNLSKRIVLVHGHVTIPPAFSNLHYEKDQVDRAIDRGAWGEIFWVGVENAHVEFFPFRKYDLRPPPQEFLKRVQFTSMRLSNFRSGFPRKQILSEMSFLRCAFDEGLVIKNYGFTCKMVDCEMPDYIVFKAKDPHSRLLIKSCIFNEPSSVRIVTKETPGAYIEICDSTIDSAKFGFKMTKPTPFVRIDNCLFKGCAFAFGFLNNQILKATEYEKLTLTNNVFQNCFLSFRKLPLPADLAAKTDDSDGNDDSDDSGGDKAAEIDKVALQQTIDYDKILCSRWIKQFNERNEFQY